VNSVLGVNAFILQLPFPKCMPATYKKKKKYMHASLSSRVTSSPDFSFLPTTCPLMLKYLPPSFLIFAETTSPPKQLLPHFSSFISFLQLHPFLKHLTTSTPLVSLFHCCPPVAGSRFRCLPRLAVSRFRCCSRLSVSRSRTPVSRSSPRDPLSKNDFRCLRFRLFSHLSKGFSFWFLRFWFM
jgi:hypothetical protein